jgi:hypothetical protein
MIVLFGSLSRSAMVHGAHLRPTLKFVAYAQVPKKWETIWGYKFYSNGKWLRMAGLMALSLPYAQKFIESTKA